MNILVKIGSEPGLEAISARIKEFYPGLKIFGISSHPGQPNYFDEVITTSTEAMLGAHPASLMNRLFVRPELFEQLSKVEGQLIRMADRVALHDLTKVMHPRFPVPKYRDSLADRTQLVLRQAAYWDHVLESKEISAIVFQNYGHIGWDALLQDVAAIRGIPFLFFHEVRPFLGRQYVHDSVQGIGGLTLGASLVEMVKKSGGWVSSPVSGLNEMIAQLGLDEDPISDTNSPTLRRSLGRNMGRFREPSTLLPRLKRSLGRRLMVRASVRDEKKSVSTVPIPTKYLFCELQSQPNATTAVKGWMFADQRESIAFAAHHLPHDWSLVVRESDRQWSRMLPRRKNFWSHIASIPKVHVVDSTTNINSLLEHARGVIETSYSTRAFDALKRGVPIIVFGHTHIGGLPNVWNVRTSTDLAKAISIITDESFNFRSKVDVRQDLINFAIENERATVPGALSSTPQFNDQLALEEHQTAIITNIAAVVVSWLKTLKVPSTEQSVNNRSPH